MSSHGEVVSPVEVVSRGGEADLCDAVVGRSWKVKVERALPSRVGALLAARRFAPGDAGAGTSLVAGDGAGRPCRPRSIGSRPAGGDCRESSRVVHIRANLHSVGTAPDIELGRGGS